jgi:hypothetical protein
MADQSLIKGAAALAKAESAMSLAGVSGAAQAGANIGKAAMFIAADLEKKAKEEELKDKNLQGVATSVKNKITVGSKTGIFEDQITEEAKGYRLEVDKIATDKSLSFDERERQIRSKLDEFNVSAGRYGEVLQLYGNIVDAGELGNFSNLMDKDSVLELLNASNEGKIKGTKEGIYIYADEKKQGEPIKIITFDELKSDKYTVIQKNTREIQDFVNSAYQKGARAQNEKEKEGAIESLINTFTVDQKERILNDSFAAGKYLDKGDNTEAAFKAYATELINQQYSPPETQAIGLDENAQIGANIINQASTIDGLMGVIGQSLRSYDYQLLDNETIGFRSGVDKDGNVLYSDTIKINTPEGRSQAIFKALDNNPFLTGATKSDIWKYITSNGITITEEDKSKAGNENTALEQTGYPTKMSRPQKERLRGNWLVKVNDGEFDKYLQDNNIPKEGAINKSTGMVKSTIVNRPDFKEAFGNEYPANTYREGSVLLGKMQSEFYGKDFTGAPTGGFTKETRTEYEQRTQATKKEELGKTDKKNRAKYFRKSAKDLTAYDQLAKNDENIPKLSAEDFESFIDTGELDGKYVNIILNNKDKFSSTLIDLIQKNFK